MTRATTISADEFRATQSEKAWQAVVVDLACVHGWVAVHFRQMVGNPAGYPDLMLFRGEEVILAELKTETGRVSRRQQEWIDKLAAVGTTVHVWRPSEWSIVVEMLRGER